MDQAAGRVAAEQRALRALEHFDPLDIVEVVDGLREVGKVDAVDIDRIAAFLADRRIGRAHAADEDQPARAGARELHARDHLRQIPRGVDAVILQ